ncbi:MAG: type II toxin-antitoxin system Phd/YefM family antitoxin [Caulobacteraceae bacterium]
MSVQINIAEAKAKLSELVARAEAGEEVVLARAGKRVARIVPETAIQPRQRVLGGWAHLGIDIPDAMFIGPDSETGAAVDAWADKSLSPK